MSQPEVEAFGWSHRPLELLLDDGSTLYATADEEMNEAGVLVLERRRRGDLLRPLLDLKPKRPARASRRVVPAA